MNIANASRTAYDLAFQVSPIVLTGGLASGILGGNLPISALYGQVAGFVQGALSTGSLGTEDFQYRFVPLPGSTVISQTVGMYPFANQLVAANATVQQPLSISLQMIAPVKDAGGYLTKLAIFTALQQSLLSHNASGGSYTVATPSFIYTGCLLTSVTDITGAETKQQQVAWQFDFVQPLISKQQALAAQSALMSKLSNGAQITSPSWSSAGATNGQPAQSGLLNNGIAGSVINFLSGGP